MSHLDILFPFALPPAELATDLCKELKTPALARLIARAKKDRNVLGDETSDGFHRALPHERWLAYAFHGKDALKRNSDLPIAPALMRSFGLDCADGTWFVLQPVHIHIARDHLVLTDPRQLMLSEQDSRALFEIARPLFDEAGKTLLYGNAATWFARADDWADLQTSTPDAASGRNIDIWMPSGPGERDWRKVQNEVQMHWFDSAINVQREARREKPVNSIWLWGGAAASDIPAPRRYTAAFNLCAWMQAFCTQVPMHAHADTASTVIAAKPQQGLIVLDALLEPALASDWARWLASMHALEEKWFAPLLQAFQGGAVERLSLVATHDTQISEFIVTRASLRKFWIKPSLSPLCS